MTEQKCRLCGEYNSTLSESEESEMALVEITPLPAINLTTGEKDETAKDPYFALFIASETYDVEEYFPILYCPLCGRDLRRFVSDKDNS